jgi:hypothetical protein
LNGELGIAGENNLNTGMKKISIYFFLTSFFILSCNEVLFHDEERTRSLYLENFHAVKISGIYNIFLIQDSANRLDITGVNDINSIDAIIKDDTLFIDNHKKISFNPHKNRLDLHFSNLSFMETNDPVNISNLDTIKAYQFIYYAFGEIVEARMVFDCDNLYFVSFPYSFGFFHFRGKTNSCLLWNNYGSTIFADSLYCKDAEVINSSVGDVYVNASDNLRASIHGPGNIYYHGTPVIEIAEKTGGGSIIPLH